MNRKTANTVSKADATIITGPRTRLSYAHLFEPHSFTSKDTAKYSSNLLIPKDDKRTLDRIHAAIKAAYELGKNRLLEKDGSIPALKDLTLPLRDGDEEFPDDPAYESMLFMSAKNKYQPTLYDQAGHKITDPCVIAVCLSGLIPWKSSQFWSVSDGIGPKRNSVFSLMVFSMFLNARNPWPDLLPNLLPSVFSGQQNGHLGNKTANGFCCPTSQATSQEHFWATLVSPYLPRLSDILLPCCQKC